MSDPQDEPPGPPNSDNSKSTDAKSNKKRDAKPKTPPGRSPLHWTALLAMGVLLTFVLTGNWDSRLELTYSEVLDELEADNVKSVSLLGRQQLVGELKQPPVTKEQDASEDDSTSGKSTEKQEAEKQVKFHCSLPLQVGESWLAELRAKNVVIEAEPPVDYSGILGLISMLVFGFLIVMMWTNMRRSRDQMLGGGGMLASVTKSPARRYDEEDKKITFEDVAGLKGVKNDLLEIVEFLKTPEKFHRLGASVPKGVLLMGPPGTGKTLLARAVAGEAGVPFFSISGSEFIQLFVGVGAGRVRDMFKTAQDNSPSILFIDEIDAVGRQRGAGLGGGHDEREQTLNQILSEMDGFTPGSTVIVMAATNRPDVLDPALLRPGRFDRHITVDRPTYEGRLELFQLHARNVPITENVDFERLARATAGLTGADIRNLVNEAALWATRGGKDKVDQDDFEYARDKTLMGALREDVLTEEEKELTAYHEAGHALLAWLQPGSNLVHKVTIIPRGRALGVTQLVPEEERHNIGQQRLRTQLVMALGGRTAEKLKFNEYTAGAQNDLQRATELARRMVTDWGMSVRLGPVSYSLHDEHPFLGREMAHEQRPYSEKTAQAIDEEVSRILHEASDQAEQLLSSHMDKLETLSQALLEQESLNTEEIVALIGPSQHNHSSPEATKASTQTT